MSMTAHSTAKKPSTRVHSGGRQRVVIDPLRLDELIRIGCRDNELAEAFGVSEAVLQRKFRSHISKKRGEIRASLRAKQVDLALAGDRTMLIWLGKNMIGQSDRADITSDGEALKVIVERIG